MHEELRFRQCAQVDRFPRHYIVSIGAHVFNLMNQEKKIYWRGALVPNTRLHIMFVSPPGFSGTFWLEQFIRESTALIRDCNIDTAFEGSMTEAGFVGTVKFVDGSPQITAGAAQMFNKSILGIEEFSAITTMMSQQHSRLLDSAMLGDSTACSSINIKPGGGSITVRICHFGRRRNLRDTILRQG